MEQMEYTFSMIKPDILERNLVGNVIGYLEKSGLKIVAQKMSMLTIMQARDFYIEHKNRLFFVSLLKYISSGPVILQVLSSENAVTKNRQIMGATNPADAPTGTIRGDFGVSVEANSIHGSDSLQSANREIKFFFSDLEIYK